MQYNTDDVRITRQEEAPAPEDIISQYPMPEQGSRVVVSARNSLADIFRLQDKRLALVVGPCSIHDPKAAMEYAQRLAEMAVKYAEDLFIVMRVYFEKPRTTIGWKGLINDPNLDGSYEVNKGLKLARQLLLEIVKLKLPAGTEYLDPITPQYIGDLISWAAIGARTTESQIHRQLASGLSCPVGFKNNTEGSIQVAVDAANSARHQHIFLGVTKQGYTATFFTSGNDDCHIVLRGGRAKTNYDEKSIQAAHKMLTASGQESGIMVDMSHANSQKKHERQMVVCEELCRQISNNNQQIAGAMLESNLVAGQQNLAPGADLIFGQSITDACIGWDDTVICLEQLAKAVRKRRLSPAAHAIG